MEDIEFPTDDGIFKVIQLYIDKKPVLRMGNMDTYHATILKDTLKEYEIDNFETKKRGPVLIPAEKGDRYELVGAGVCMKFEQVHFYGESIDYGVRIDKEHLSHCNQEKDGIELIFGN